MIAEALARFRLEVEPVEKFQLVQVALESGRGTISISIQNHISPFLFTVSKVLLNLVISYQIVLQSGKVQQPYQPNHVD